MRVSTTDSLSTKKFLHGLGEVPLLVDVQVKAIDGPNKGYIFQASGKRAKQWIHLPGAR
ncbi:hypothetical protein DPMN_184584 [Dreissena polymorpha]|uniref:Uncharacterized protein n=1 Tax=Dreissena polymorpha TaxID=45954 RepID=A0A9D4I7J8_DREPO|nr:hypothetical protein DPMN_184584 [Dreissena polymorpha]